MKKILERKLKVTRKKVSNSWKVYQKEKTRILNMRLSSELKQNKIKKLRKKTYNKVSNEFTNYSLKKDEILKIKRDFKPYKQPHVIKDYKLKSFVGKANEQALQRYLTKLKYKDKIKTILIIFEYKKISTGEIILKTESFSKESFLKYLNSYDELYNNEFNEGELENEFIDIKGLSIFNLVQQKFENISEGYLNDLKLEKIYIKVYYIDK